MSDVMSVRLHLSGVRVRGVLVDSVEPSRGRSGINPGVVEVPTLWVPLPQGVGQEGEEGS